MATARSAPRVVVPYRVRRVRALLVLCAIGVGFVTVLGALSAPGPPRGPRPGPLRVAAASRLANPQPVGVPFTYGLPVVLNGGAAPVRIDRVLLVDPTRGLRLLRVYAGGPRRRYDSAVTDPSSGFPRRRSLFADLHPARGYSVAPQRSTAG